MRRTPGFVIALAFAAAGCSPGGGVSVSTDVAGNQPVDGSSDPTAEARSGDISDGDARPDAGDAADGPSLGGERPRVALPGLVDTSDDPVPDDPEVRTGTLANGLRYYVRANDNPGGRAELRLAVDAGSVDELGRSTGTAHFVEHMLFNGTERFPENELIDVLRSFGAAFGADINASTSYDATVYSLTVPNAEESLEAGLTVLEQWLSHATFDREQVLAERGVVLDEWRVRTQSAQGRLFAVAAELFLTGTPYSGREPIGDAESIEEMAASELVEFYDAWYRPDNASVVVVGDIVVEEVVADIERLFGPAAARSQPMPDRPVTSFDLDREPDVAVHADPDQQTVDVEVTLPLPAFRSNGTAEIRAAILDAMIYDALVRRLSRDVAGGVAPFDRVTRGGNSLVEGLDAPALYAFTDASRVGATLESLLDEYGRAERFGFSADEVAVARDEIGSFFRSRYEGRDSTQDRDYADTYAADFLRDAGFPAIATEYEVVVATLQAVTPDALVQRFRARWDNSAPHVIISAPAAVVDQMPTRTDVLATIDALADRALEPRASARALRDSLMEPPVPIRPASIEELLGSDDPFLDPIEVEFPNGVRVILNENEIVEGQTFLLAASPGGSSLVPDGDVVDALFAAEIVTSGGVADFDQVELARVLAGRDVVLDAAITPYLEQFVGSAATADLEALFQLIHLYMTAPRFDPVALGQVRSRFGPVVADPASAPDLAAQDAVLDARYPGELRYAVLPEPDEFATLDLDGVERVWSSRFGNAAGWVFVLSGDLDLDEATDLASAYLGTLPVGADETWVDVAPPPPDEVVEVSVRAGTGDTASLTMLFTSPVSGVDERLRVAADVTAEVLAARLTDVVRERLGESYSPRATTRVTTDPDPTVETSVSVTGAPERVDQLAALVVGELEQLASDGPSSQEFANAFAQVQETYNFVNNGDFITELLDDAIHPALDLDDYILEFAALAAVDEATVRDYVREHTRTDRYIQVIVVPR